MEIIQLDFSFDLSGIYHLLQVNCNRAEGRQIDRLVREIIEILPQAIEFLKSYDRELIWLYPFAWAVIIVRKIFYA